MLYWESILKGKMAKWISGLIYFCKIAIVTYIGGFSEIQGPDVVAKRKCNVSVTVDMFCMWHIMQ